MARKQHGTTGRMLDTEAFIFASFDQQLKRPVLIIEDCNGKQTRWIPSDDECAQIVRVLTPVKEN